MTPQLAIWLLPLIMVLLGAVIVRYLDLILRNHKEAVDYLKKKQDEQGLEMQEIKENYLSRFEKVNANISESKLIILERLHSIELFIKKK